MTRSRRALACVLSASVAVLVLAGCVAPDEPEPAPTRTETQEPTPTSTPTIAPVLDGTAEQNQEFFDQVNRALIDSGAGLNGGAFIDNLVANGYARESMEVTPDTTAIGIAADNIVFSIRFEASCLLGQWGNIGYTSLVTELPSTGRCIIGTARPA